MVLVEGGKLSSWKLWNNNTCKLAVATKIYRVFPFLLLIFLDVKFERIVYVKDYDGFL
jgi:hypothetical protein